MLTAPDWALGSRYLRENAPELIPFIEKYGPCNLQPEAPEKYFGTLVTKNILARLLLVSFPSSFRRMSAWQWLSAWKKLSGRR